MGTTGYREDVTVVSHGKPTAGSGYCAKSRLPAKEVP